MPLGVVVGVLRGAAHDRTVGLARAGTTIGARGPRPPLPRDGRLGADGVSITIRDRGVGVKPEDLSRIFDPYFTTKRTGSGLGLAIAKNIIEGMGGSIVLESRPDLGTEIRIELPTVPAGAATPGARTEASRIRA